MPALTADQRIQFARTVWYEFQRKARTKREMSSTEWHVLSKWMDRGLPLSVVLRGLTDFAGQPRRLEGIVASVEESVERWHKAVGSLTELPEAGPLEDEPEFDVAAARRRRDEMLKEMRGERHGN